MNTSPLFFSDSAGSAGLEAEERRRWGAASRLE